MHTVDVVIPTKNRVKLLRRALNSVMSQTFRDFTVFVINDGSTDETARWLSNLNHPKIKFLNLPASVGPSKARNLAVNQGDAPFISFLDDDDEYMPEYLAQCLKNLSRPGAGDFSLSSYENESKGHKFRKRGLPNFVPDKQMLFRMMVYRIVIVSTSQMVVRRTAFQRVGGFDTRLTCYEDHDLALKLLRYSTAELINNFSWKKHFVSTSISRSMDRMDHFLKLTQNHSEYSNAYVDYTNAWLFRYLIKSKYFGNNSETRALVKKVCSYGFNWSISPLTVGAFKELDSAYNHYLTAPDRIRQYSLEEFFRNCDRISEKLKRDNAD